MQHQPRRIIASRRQEQAGKSYTKELLEGGAEKCARKLGEEAVETVIAALGTDTGALKREAADLLYHLLVLLEVRQVYTADVGSDAINGSDVDAVGPVQLRRSREAPLTLEAALPALPRERRDETVGCHDAHAVVVGVGDFGVDLVFYDSDAGAV